MPLTNPKEIKIKSPGRGLFWIILSIFLIAGIIFGSDFAFAKIYKNKIYPGIHIGKIEVGGKTKEEAELLIKNKIDDLQLNGFILLINGKEIKISPTIFAQADPDMARELITFDVDGVTNQAMNMGRNSNILKNLVDRIKNLVSRKKLSINVSVNEDELSQNISNQIQTYLYETKNARFDITWVSNQPTITIVNEVAGSDFDRAKMFSDIINNFSQLKSDPIELKIERIEPQIKTADIAPLQNSVSSILNSNVEWKLRFTDEDKEWKLSPVELSSMIGVDKDQTGQTEITLLGTGFDNFLEIINNDVSRSPQNAKFVVENGKVVDFTGSANGIELDKEKTKLNMVDAFINRRNPETEVALKISEPEIKTSEVNDLGIEEVLGVGISNFRNSPTNRIKNIKNGARLLNGIIIKPNEEFSLLKALEPFTIENGFLPELVIKGDKIVPEVGGGLCQIGTTTFRATMNSGLPVISRTNHSLVVTYYNDPSNGNPGTDATIYDPAPDFKLKNDTPGHMLLTTEVDMTKKELRFTFWGKNDGRKGYYSPPIVDRWIPTGPTTEIETTDLKPGEKNCQSRHPGADAHFTYTVEKSDETKQETLYTSHYRPLPEICLVGVENLTTQENVPTNETPNTDQTLTE